MTLRRSTSLRCVLRRRLLADGSEETLRIRQVRKHRVSACPPQLLLGERPGRHTDSPRPGRGCALHVEWRIPDDDSITRRIHGDAGAPGPFHGDGHEIVTPGGVVAVRATDEVAPKLEVVQLDAGRTSNVPGHERTGYVRRLLQAVEQLSDPRHEPFPRPWMEDLPLEMLAVAREESDANLGVDSDPGMLEGIAQDEKIRPPGHRNAGESACDAEQLLEGAVESPLAGAAREKQRPVDVEEKKSRQSNNRFTSATESAATASAVNSARNARKLVTSAARAGIE